MSNEVNEVINNICDKLGYAVSEITPEMAKYMIAQNGLWLFWGIVGIVVGALVIVCATKHYKKACKDNPYYDSAFEFIIVFVTACVMIFACVDVCVSSVDLIGWIASPKASMVQYVLDAIK